MVCGHTDYDGRGLNVCQSFEDLEQMYLRPNTARLRKAYFTLQFAGPAITSYGTLDNIAGLDLPLASNDPRGETIPFWTTTESESRCLPIEDIDSIISQWSNPPTHVKWQFLAKVARATAFFASEPGLAMRGAGNAPIIITTTPVVLCGMQVTGGSFIAPQPRMCPAEELATMSIGDTTKCNFCNKPNDSEMKVDCQCCGIRYCSERCRMKDRARHEKACGTN